MTDADTIDLAHADEAAHVSGDIDPQTVALLRKLDDLAGVSGWKTYSNAVEIQAIAQVVIARCLVRIAYGRGNP